MEMLRSRAMPENGGPEEGGALRNLCRADYQFVERYEGWTELGSGGSNSVVIRTVRKAGRTEIAVKVFYNLPPDARERFDREVEIASSISSPYVVRVYSPFSRGELAWFEMEYVEGSSIAKELAGRIPAKEPWPLPDALEIITDVARGVAAAHAKKVLHRDIKAANVLLPASRIPRAKLTDFSIAKVHDAPSLTRTGHGPMTPGCCSPEQAAGNIPLGLPHDIYGVGFVLFQLLTALPNVYASLTAESPLAKYLHAAMKERPRSLRSVCEDLPVELEDIYASCMRKDPNARPSAVELVERLESLAKVVTAPAPGVAQAKRGIAPRWRRALLGAAVAFGVLLLLASGLVLRRSPSSASPSVDALGVVEAVSPGAVSAGPPPVSAALEGGFLAVTAREALEGATLEIADGDAHQYRLEPLAAGDSVWVALSGFSPPLAPETPVRRMMLLVRGSRYEVPVR